MRKVKSPAKSGIVHRATARSAVRRALLPPTKHHKNKTDYNRATCPDCNRYVGACICFGEDYAD